MTTGLIFILAAVVVLVQIAAYLFVFAALLLGATMLAGAAVSRWFKWWNRSRIRADMGPHKSRGWE